MNISIAQDDRDDKFYIKEDRLGFLLSGPYDYDLSNPDDSIINNINKKIEIFENIQKVILSAFNELKDSGVAFGRNEIANLFASCLHGQHNTDQASIIRTIRKGLEIYETNSRSDARNQVALEWIKAGREVDHIPFI